MGSNDELQRFRTLQAAVRGRSADDGSPLEKLTAGELTEDEAAALRAETEQSDQGKLDFELFRPLDAEEKGRIQASVRARVRAEASRRWRLRLAAGSSALALVAALTPLYVHTRVRVDVAWASSMGPRPEPVLMADQPGATIGLRILPVNGFEGQLEVRGAAFVENGKVIPWAPHVSSEGSQINLSGTREELFPCRKGEVRILVAVGVPGPQLPPGELLGHEGRPWFGRYQVLGKSVFLGDKPVARADGTPCSP